MIYVLGVVVAFISGLIVAVLVIKANPGIIGITLAKLQKLADAVKS